MRPFWKKSGVFFWRKLTSIFEKIKNIYSLSNVRKNQSFDMRTLEKYLHLVIYRTVLSIGCLMDDIKHAVKKRYGFDIPVESKPTKFEPSGLTKL